MYSGDSTIISKQAIQYIFTLLAQKVLLDISVLWKDMIYHSRQIWRLRRNFM